MVISEDLPDSSVSRVVIRPNRSLTWRQSMIFLAAIAIPLLLISIVLAARGFWLVLPFAGLEIVALFASFYVVSHAAERCEIVSIDQSLVTIEKGRNRSRLSTRGGSEQRIEFARGWVKVELAESARRWYPQRLWLGASGRRVEIGGFLAEDEKAELAARLQKMLAA